MRRTHGDVGPARIAELLHESYQTISNWAARGVSRDGAIKVERVMGSPAVWILFGEVPPEEKKPQRYPLAGVSEHFAKEPDWGAWPFRRVSTKQWSELTGRQRDAVEDVVLSYLPDGLAKKTTAG